MNSRAGIFFADPHAGIATYNEKYARTKRATLPRLPGVALCVDTYRHCERSFIYTAGAEATAHHVHTLAHVRVRAQTPAPGGPLARARWALSRLLSGPYIRVHHHVWRGHPERRGKTSRLLGLPQAYERGYRFLIRYA